MANFCKYCGKPMPETGICECENAANQTQQSEGAEGGAPIVNQPVVVQTGESPAMKALNDAKTLFISFMKQPIATLESAFIEENKLPQLLMGALYAIVLFLCILIRSAGVGNAFGGSIMLTLVFCIVKLLYVSLVYFFNRKNGVKFKSVLSLFCLISIPETICVLVFFLLSFIATSAFMGLVIVGLMLFVSAIISNTIAAAIVFKENKDKFFWFYMLINFIVIMLMAFFLKAVVISSIQTAVSSLGSYLRYF